ncbi:apoptosis-enhancing nuclease [Myxocyprinus asiaticus]|uniref:apoptosis-enhancing nuclease n=1 Tax=Myxocyprinus asiaticus TaxID=70543 RepID=UPI002222B211|nr:apoptosis-enhancing nuclease [Myxocyprinus asiaticus]
MSTSTWKHLTSHSVDQNIFPAPNKQTTTISHQTNGRRRREKIKMKDCTMEFHEMSCDQRRGTKRKSNKLLENRTELIKPSNDTLEQTNHVQIKRPKVTPEAWTGEAELALLVSDSWEVDSGFSSETSPPTSGRSSPCVGISHSKLVALDCEMVGTGPGGQYSEVARCSIVNYYGGVIYDKYILPQQPVTDYRTRWSGIRKHHLGQAVPFEDAQNEIIDILKGKVIIGHALNNDFFVLDLSVPEHMVRDTCTCSWLRELYVASDRCNISLKKLAWKLLNRTIQVGRLGHCSVQDARAALDLYKLVEDQWEKDFLARESITDHTSDPNNSLEHYMQDQYWPESMMDCSP